MNEITLDSSSNFKLQWELIENDEILFILSANLKTWLGIGWSNSYGMNNADYIIGTFNKDGTLNITDRILPDGAKYQSPYIDSKVGGTNDILTSYGYQTQDYTYIKFTRKLITNDTIGDRDISTTSSMNLIWARGAQTQESLKYHQQNRGELSINFGQPNDNSNDPDYISWHIGLMFSAFAVLMPMGIFIARYFKKYHYWFPIHYILLGTAFAFAIVGFIISFIMTSGHTFSKDVLHAWFGLFTIIFMTLSVVFGITSHFMWDSSRKLTPIFPDYVHHYIARLTYLLALVSIWTGFNVYGTSKIFSIILGFVVALFISLAIFLEVYKKLYPKESLLNDDIKDDNSKSELNENNIEMEGASGN